MTATVESQAALEREFGTPGPGGAQSAGEGHSGAVPATSSALMVQRWECILEDPDTGDLYALQVTTDMRDARAFAGPLGKASGLPMNLDPTQGLAGALAWTAWTTWHAARHRQHSTELDWPAWSALLVDAHPAGDPEPVPPTPPGTPNT